MNPRCLVCLWLKADERRILDSEMTNTDVADIIGCSEASVRRHKKHESRVTSSQVTVLGGESEIHESDGSASYVRFSLTPWGFEDYRDFIKSKGQNPDEVTFTWGWTSNPGGGFWNKLNNVRPLTPAPSVQYDLPLLYSQTEVIPPHTRPKNLPDEETTLVVCLSDLQIGKTGSRGGTPELLVRLESVKGKLREELEARTPQRILLVEAGDLFENFESGGNPMFTNDLSLSQQLDLAGTILFDFIKMCEAYAEVTVATVTSNHTAWRKGKLELGRPQDDLGIFVHKQVEKLSKEAKLQVSWVYPPDYSDSVIVPVFDTLVGITHGHRVGNQRRVLEWWKSQQHGGQPVGQADILVHGHWHHFSYTVTGRNPHTGRIRRIIGLPTLDNGSDWFRAFSGEDSDPGMVIFEITKTEGFRLKSLDIL